MRLVNGISMAGYATSRDNGVTPLRLTHAFAGCRDLEAYWEALRGACIVPKRTDFDPRGIERTLTQTFVAERVAPSVVRMRVAGTQLNDLLGMDVRGMPITAFFDADSRNLISDACKRLFDGPEKVTLELKSAPRFGRSAQHARLILLPMSDGHGEITRVVGCLETVQTGHRHPSRFSVTQVRSEALEGHAPRPVVVAPNYVIPSEPQRAPEFADITQTSFRTRRARPAAPKPKHHLRLVVSNS